MVAHDLHPQYLSTSYARRREEVELVGVQHHHAHLAACLAEHGSAAPAVGAIFDGTGYGTDETVWGGELLVGGLADFTRAGHLPYVPMPGGEAAVREPWRMACAWLLAAEAEAPAALRHRVEGRRWDAVASLARAGVASPLTSSMGRLFDAVAALCGLRVEVTYEGQAAIDLESVSDRSERGAYPMPVVKSEDGVLLDARETVAAVAADAGGDADPALVGARFHNGVARATAEACALLAAERGLDTVVLSGGVFQNRLLLERTLPALSAAGLRALVPERLPPGDGGIAFGQAAVAAARLAGKASSADG